MLSPRYPQGIASVQTQRFEPPSGSRFRKLNTVVKIRLKRMGNKHRPFYRIVVAKSASSRDSAAIEYLGTYDPINKDPQTKRATVDLKGDRALHWLKNGAQPTETVAIILQRQGVLDQFFAERPSAKRKFGFLDKTTQAMSQQSAISQVEAPAETPAETPADAPAEAAAEPEAPQATVEPTEAPAEEATTE